ncbi:MAG: non-hydrolyzing UDP-N-acetylglucosamine 2-epimerase [Acidimicrobiales bacterium]
MRPIVIAGARPNFVKVAPLLRSMRKLGMEPALVHTGQHYDWAMSEALFADLGIPEPDVNLGVGSGSQGAQTAKVMTAFEEWFDENGGDQLVVVGDVNSTVATTLVAAKRGIPVAHVEAGLRSYDRTMPEEVNRLAVDALATWLFTPSADGDENLAAEGVHPSRVHLVGNIMVDSLLESLPRARRLPVRDRLGITGPYGLVTLHRPALVDDEARLAEVVGALRDIADDLPLVFPVHPRTRARLGDAATDAANSRISFVDPVGYLEFLHLEAEASLVLTDSGGVQEETTVLGVPCLTLRENTERPITITLGTNRLVGLDPAAIVAAARDALGSTAPAQCPPLWDGRTAGRIAAVLAAGTPDVEWVPPRAAAGAAVGRLASPVAG